MEAEDKRLYGKICYIHRQMCRENSQLFSEYGISPVQLHALVFIEKMTQSGERVCQKDIERKINLRPSSISTLISNLERDGFLTRTVSEGDARTKYLALTEKGKNVCFKDRLLMDRCDGAISAALSEDEQKDFDFLLTKIISTISDNKIIG